MTELVAVGLIPYTEIEIENIARDLDLPFIIFHALSSYNGIDNQEKHTTIFNTALRIVNIIKGEFQKIGGPSLSSLPFSFSTRNKNNIPDGDLTNHLIILNKTSYNPNGIYGFEWTSQSRVNLQRGEKTKLIYHPHVSTLIPDIYSEKVFFSHTCDGYTNELLVTRTLGNNGKYTYFSSNLIH